MKWLATLSILAIGLTACAPVTTGPAASSVAPVAALSVDRERDVADRSEPVTLLVSIDGFKPDYLKRGVTPNLNALAANGVSARMRPSFPSKTFPNHYTIVTGKRPDTHGIVGNTMVDPRRPEPGATFSLGNAAQALDPFWWNEAEPLWVTAEKQNVRTATMFWPGSEVSIHSQRPQDWGRFDQNISDRQRVATIVDWLRRPAASRPRFLTLYFDTVDTAGHRFGPDAAETTRAVAEVDAHIGAMLRDIAALRQPVDVVVVSDHGMMNVGPPRVARLDEWLPRDAYRLVTSGTYAGLDPLPGKADIVAAALLRRQPHPNVRCHEKSRIPRHLHYGTNRRVPAVLCLADPGWEIAPGPTEWKGRGDHGYDPALPDMHATFIASGPSFQRAKLIPTFDNVEVYDLLARLIGVRGLPNDGSGALAPQVIAE